MNKRTYNLAPGNILQNMYLKTRQDKTRQDKTFIEVGAGNGMISNILLRYGMTGMSFELNPVACQINNDINKDFIEKGTYLIYNRNFFEITQKDVEQVDVIISSHVIEHFSEQELFEYFEQCKQLVKKNGKIISIVPASMKYWGIEDETCGHYRRFEYRDFDIIAQEHHLRVSHLVGLTYPLSNVLFRLSNSLIAKQESWKKTLSKAEQTELSSSGGAKVVQYKTHFPYYFRYIINEITMYPFFLLQLLFKTNRNCMVIYCEYQGI